MSIVFHPGQVLTQNDLKISIRDSGSTLIDPYYIRYSLFDYTTGMEVLIGDADRIPATTGVGNFYVNAMVPMDANIGDWIVRWNFREASSSPMVQVAQEFAVVKADVVISITGDPNKDNFIRRLRILLRDNNPDRNYRFRPPSTEKFLQSQAQVFGYIWEDDELLEYLLFAVDDLNSGPPVTGVTLDDIPDRWRTAILIKAAAFACMAISMNWISDEFNYSISGVSLDIDKSSKYQSMKQNFESEYDKAKEGIKRSIKITKGLKQPRYGIGISSALGPYSKPGTQSRRNFTSGTRGGWS